MTNPSPASPDSRPSQPPQPLAPTPPTHTGDSADASAQAPAQQLELPAPTDDSLTSTPSSAPPPSEPEDERRDDPLEPLFRGRQARLVLTDPLPSAPPGIRRVTCEPVVVRGEPHWQIALFTATQATHRNLTRRAARTEIFRLATQFRQAQLHTSTLRVTLKPPRQRGQLWRTLRQDPIVAPPPLPATHNRQPRHPLPEGTPCPFLVEIGVMTPEGQVRSARQAKFRQVNRFLELVHDLLAELPQGRPLRVVDFGCGKSYLTFALHHWLTGPLGREVDITGLDLRADVIADCRQIAARLGCAGLKFEQGTIAGFQPSGPVDLVVALHACDTATDDALAQAIGWQAGAILAVPCCQHELAPQLAGPGLAALLRHGILRERLAALATDALRAGVLELVGYSTQVIEFIDLEHTAKNLLLRARRRSPRETPPNSGTPTAVAPTTVAQTAGAQTDTGTGATAASATATSEQGAQGGELPAFEPALPPAALASRVAELAALKATFQLGTTHLENRLTQLGWPALIPALPVPPAVSATASH